MRGDGGGGKRRDEDEDRRERGGGGGEDGFLLSEREVTFFDLLSTIKRSWRRDETGDVD